jgi:aminopeptidase N
MRLFYSRYRNGNALTDDFRKCMEEVSKKPLEEFFHQWLYVSGQPDLNISSETGKKKGTILVTIQQVQDFTFSFDIELGIKDSKGSRIITVPVTQKITTVNINAEDGFELTPDPGVKLLFRIVPAESGK